VKSWGIYEYLLSTIERFRSTLPLIIELRHPAMRERHWRELKNELTTAEDFDPRREDFTLEKIFRLNLLSSQEKIYELTDNAKKQLKIEDMLKEIKRLWKRDPATDLEIKPIKSSTGESYYKIGSTDNVYQFIDDHVVKLGNMKSSPYYKQFKETVDKWEIRIGQLTETLELLLQVQGMWLYLESIFKGQPETEKMMPKESKIFGKTHDSFKLEMERINKDRNALKSLNHRGFIPLLTELKKNLEYVQKQLNQLLESKRNLFPRFYFLSNDDLIEIIGQTKDPSPVNTHIKKIFEGIGELKYSYNK